MEPNQPNFHRRDFDVQRTPIKMTGNCYDSKNNQKILIVLHCAIDALINNTEIQGNFFFLFKLNIKMKFLRWISPALGCLLSNKQMVLDMSSLIVSSFDLYSHLLNRSCVMKDFQASNFKKQQQLNRIPIKRQREKLN